jgi:hypothetical protein
MEEQDRSPQALVDPDPFSIGLGIYAAIAGGGTFLEARRQRVDSELQHLQQFRGAWFACRRTLIFFKRSVDEFESYMLEQGYSRTAFRIGAIRLTVDFGGRKAMRRLNGQILMTAEKMADNFDDLSDYLGVDDAERVSGILIHLRDLELPATYRDVIRIARDVGALFTDLLDDIGERESFPRDANEPNGA